MKNSVKRVVGLMLTLILLVSQLTFMTVYSFPDGTIQSTLSEEVLLDEMLDSLVLHTAYTETLFRSHPTLENAGSFTGPKGDISTEYGIRTHNNYVLLYAFLYKELPDSKFVNMPEAINTREKLKSRMTEAITYSIKTHSVIDEAKCPDDGLNWGGVWQSSMWASKLGFACYLVWDDLSSELQEQVTDIIVYEADLIAARNPVIGQLGDTKAEENGWDTNIVALAYNMFPDHENAAKWDNAAKLYAMNTLSMESDASNTELVDGKPVKDWFLGANIFNDYSIENHNIFHPVYQLSVLYEFADSVMYYKMKNNPVPEAFNHNTKESFDKVIKKLLLPTGAVVFPNGTSQWSLDTLDAIDCYAFMATYYKDADAKLAEQRAWQAIYARQRLIYQDGRYIGPLSDTGARRESVQTERIIVSYLCHKYFGSWDSAVTTWNDFAQRNTGNGTFSDGGLVYSTNPKRFVSVSWKNKFMALVVPDGNEYLDNGFVYYPYAKNITGQFTLSGQSAITQVCKSYSTNMQSEGFVSTGELTENSGVLNHYLSYVVLPDNGVVYMDTVKAASSGTITKEEGIPIGLRTDAMSNETRTFTWEGGGKTGNGKTAITIPGTWVNADGQIGMVVNGSSGMRFSNWTNNKDQARSAGYAKLYGSYSATQKTFEANDVVASRSAVIYSNVDADTTKNLNDTAIYPDVADGWKALSIKDTDGKRYFVVSNFYSDSTTPVTLSCEEGAPVLKSNGVINGKTLTAELKTEKEQTELHDLYAYITAPEGKTVNARQSNKNDVINIRNNQAEAVSVTISMRKADGSFVTEEKTLAANGAYAAALSDNQIILTAEEYVENPQPIMWVKAKSQNDGETIKLTWDGYSVKEDTIKIERKTFSTNWSELTSVSGDLREYVDSNITDGYSYQYRVSVADSTQAPIITDYAASKPVDENGRLNIARGKPVVCFDDNGIDTTAANRDLWRLTDGVRSQTVAEFWGTKDVTGADKLNPVTLTVDLLKTESFQTIAVVPRKNEVASSKVSYGPKDFLIQTSTDGINYTTVKAVTNYTKYNEDDVYDIDFDAPVKARYLRLYITDAYDDSTKNGGVPRSVKIREIMVYRSDDIVLYGDVNNDMTINVNDVVMLVEYIGAMAAGGTLDSSKFPDNTFPGGEKSALLTDDDDINVNDAVLLVEYIGTIAAGGTLDETKFPGGNFPGANR